MKKSGNVELWFDYFDYLEECLDTQALSSLFNKYKNFFKHLE